MKKSKILSVILALSMILTVFTAMTAVTVSAEDPATGSGVLQHPDGTVTPNETWAKETDGEYQGKWVIRTIEDLKQFEATLNAGTNFSGETVVLNADINMKNNALNLGPLFLGSFDGNGKTLYNVKVTEGREAELSVGNWTVSYGLFATLSGGSSLKNINVVGLKIEATATKRITYVGALVGYLAGSAGGEAISNCNISNFSATITGAPTAADSNYAFVGFMFGILNPAVRTFKDVNVSINHGAYYTIESTSEYSITDSNPNGNATTEPKHYGRVNAQNGVHNADFNNCKFTYIHVAGGETVNGETVWTEDDCTKGGTRTDVVKCGYEGCEETYDTAVNTIEAKTEHTAGGPVTEGTDNVVSCTVCEKELSRTPIQNQFTDSETSKDVIGVYKEGTDYGTVYSVNITWGSFSYVYNAPAVKWNATKLEYENTTEGEWVADTSEGKTDHGKVTVENSSNAAVNVNFAFSKKVETVTGSFAPATSELQSAYKGPDTPASIESVQSQFTVGGTLGENDASVIGTVSITISAVTPVA